GNCDYWHEDFSNLSLREFRSEVRKELFRIWMDGIGVDEFLISMSRNFKYYEEETMEV
ncbi:hypothetical protein MKX03_012985, partial [Papaver bracteatum]